MKHFFNTKKLPLYVLSFLAASLIVSCGTVQTTANNNDGIYNDNTETPQRKVVNTNNANYDEYNDNYFTQELRRLDYINGTDIITDIEDYKSGNYENEYPLPEDQQPEQIENYGSWGNNGNSDVVININSGWNNGWNNGYYGWNNPYAYGGYYGGFYGGGFWGANLWFGNGFYRNRFGNNFYRNRCLYH